MKRRWVIYMECGAGLAAASLSAHMEIKHGRSGCAAAETTTELLPDTQVELGGLP